MESVVDPATFARACELFRSHRPWTLRMAAEELNLPEEVTLSVLETLELRGVAIKARAGTEMPVWKARGT